MMSFGHWTAVCAVFAAATFAAEACTSWVIRPEVTESGMMIIQKILDNPYSPLDADMRVAANGWRWMRIGRFNGPSMAMNENGVVLTTNCGDRNGNGHPGGERQAFSSFGLQWQVAKNCATAAEGVDALKNIGRNCLFSYGTKVNYGTILLIADANRAFALEIGDGYCEAIELSHGMHVVTNAWSIPGNETISISGFPSIRGDRARDACARKALQDGRVNGKYTIRGCFDASRKIRGRRFNDRYPFVPGNRKARNMSLMASCFEIDPEFPAYLSCAYAAIGPQRHTVYLPIAMAVRQLPDKIRDGRWAQMAFDHQEAFGTEHSDMPKFTELEGKFLEEFKAVREDARKLLKDGKKDEAVKLLNECFDRQFAEADKLMTALDASSKAKRSEDTAAAKRQ